MASGTGGGGGLIGWLVMTPLKFWIFGTALLVALSVPLGVAFSNLVVKVYGVTLGIVSSDGPEFGGHFQEGQRSAGGAASTPDEGDTLTPDEGN